MKGFKYIAFLLSHPNKKYTPTGLSISVEGVPTDIKPSNLNEMTKNELERENLYGTDLGYRESNQKSIQSIRENASLMKDFIKELGHDLLMATNEGNYEKADEIHTKINKCKSFINSEFDHKGRPRNKGSAVDNGRTRITNQISRIKKKLEKDMPKFFDHFQYLKCLHGQFSYSPP